MHKYDDWTNWENTEPDDLWLFDKLILSRKLGYKCGPIGTDVPKTDYYIVKPITNLMGMGRGSKILLIEKETDHLPVGHFWCEIFKGRHFSVDFENGKQVLCVEGFRDPNAPLYRWNKWMKVNEIFPYPEMIEKIFPYINCEVIGHRLIEVNLRHNPDWKYNSDVIIPVWEEQKINPPKGMKFVEDEEYLRKGFYIRG